ncbi:MAG: rhomboid family intramembrane serine protease [Methyloceanibacter sp.]
MPITRALIVINIAIFALQAVYDNVLVSIFALWPLGRFYVRDLHAVVGFQPWQLVSYAFLHANLAHIGLNMLALYMFGRDVERTLGAKHYLLLYFAAVVSAAFVQLAATTATTHTGIYPTIGASGGIFGVLLAFGVLYPRRIVMLLFPPIPMPAWFLVVVFGVVELANGVLGTEAGVAHFAPLGGMLGAYLELRYWRRRVTAQR